MLDRAALFGIESFQVVSVEHPRVRIKLLSAQPDHDSFPRTK
jgi:hypothetical protein